MCGAPTASDATQCEHCGAHLAKGTCPSCFGLIFEGAKFCAHCGAPVAPTRVESAESGKCPRCRNLMNKVVIGTTKMQECPKCEGLWVDAATVEQLYAERDRQASVLQTGEPGTSSGVVEEKIQYLPCPVCSTLMNRVNFARYSNVIVDVCKAHGTWFDRDELRRTIEFIRAGGLDKAQARELTEAKERPRPTPVALGDPPWSGDSAWSDYNLTRHGGISFLVDSLIDLLR
jgi:Zn-finger nucleic acid-binding protein